MAQTSSVDWKPLNGPQSEAYHSLAFETLYGGAAGGGKSDLLLGVARTQHKRALLLRRTFPDLERSLIVRALDFYGDQQAYNASKHVWRLQGGQRIEFGHLEYERTIHQYQSAQYDLIGFDELTQFTKLQYEYMLSRVRTADKRQRVRVVACTNPGGEGNDWVMERWAAWLDEGYPHHAKSGEVRYFKRDSDGREVETKAGDPDGISRTFIAARLSDNPYLGEDYAKTLRSLPEPYRSQLANGDWQAGLTDDAYQIVPTTWIKASMQRWRNMKEESPLTCVGVDVARGGDDQTVLAPRYGAYFAELQKYPGRLTPDGPKVVALFMPLVANGGWANIDVIGVGSSVYDTAQQMNLDAVGINFAAGSSARDKSGKLGFINKRAELYWRLREALDPESDDPVALPEDSELLADLRAVRWSIQKNGIKIEDKEEVKRRISRSPDCADAIALAMDDTGMMEYVRFIA